MPLAFPPFCLFGAVLPLSKTHSRVVFQQGQAEIQENVQICDKKFPIPENLDVSIHEKVEGGRTQWADGHGPELAEHLSRELGLRGGVFQNKSLELFVVMLRAIC